MARRPPLLFRMFVFLATIALAVIALVKLLEWSHHRS
jgi:hypothetical protein